jgi:hypothetical protein
MISRALLLTLTGGLLALAPLRAPDLPAQYLPVLGGSGGTAFTRSCGADRVLTGVRFRSGLSLDAIGLLCRPVNADGSLGSESTVGTLAGGGGGTAGFASCRTGSVVGSAYIMYGSYVSGVTLTCYAWEKSTRSYLAYAGVVNAGRIGFSGGATTSCEQKSQPVVALRGREASLVDALGLICNEP